LQDFQLVSGGALPRHRNIFVGGALNGVERLTATGRFDAPFVYIPGVSC
jgi:hypothetical protein